MSKRMTRILLGLMAFGALLAAGTGVAKADPSDNPVTRDEMRYAINVSELICGTKGLLDPNFSLKENAAITLVSIMRAEYPDPVDAGQVFGAAISFGCPEMEKPVLAQVNSPGFAPLVARIYNRR